MTSRREILKLAPLAFIPGGLSGCMTALPVVTAVLKVGQAARILNILLQLGVTALEFKELFENSQKIRELNSGSSAVKNTDIQQLNERKAALSIKSPDGVDLNPYAMLDNQSIILHRPAAYGVQYRCPNTMIRAWNNPRDIAQVRTNLRLLRVRFQEQRLPRGTVFTYGGSMVLQTKYVTTQVEAQRWQAELVSAGFEAKLVS